MGTKFFSEPERNPRQTQFARNFFATTGNDIIDAMRWWVFWNDLAARYAAMVIKLEALDVELFSEMLRLTECEDPLGRAKRAFDLVPTDVNSSHRRGDRPGRLEWEDLPNVAEKTQLEEAMSRFGYELKEPSSEESR